MQERNYEATFLRMLEFIAESLGKNVTRDFIAYYDERLRKHGYEKLCVVLQQFADDPKRFPTIRDIEDRLGVGELSDEAKGRDAAARIAAAVGKFGSICGHDPDKLARIREYMGDLAWAIVNAQGGWNQICEVLTPQNTPTHTAQWRELAIAYCAKGRAGNVDEPPGLPGPVAEAIESALANTDPNRKRIGDGRNATVANLDEKGQKGKMGLRESTTSQN